MTVQCLKFEFYYIRSRLIDLVQVHIMYVYSLAHTPEITTYAPVLSLHKRSVGVNLFELETWAQV